MTRYDRRALLRLGGAAALAALAGCSGAQNEELPTNTATDTATATGTPADGAPPGADVLGGPDDLQSSATVEALSLDSDQGAGQFVFSPAVVWVEAGATVTFEDVSGSHSATAYHSGNDKPGRTPPDADPFDSGVMNEGDSFEHTFSEFGVHNYFCSPHEGLGMVGLVIVGESMGGPGTTTPEDVESSSARESLSNLLGLAGIEAGEAADAGYNWIDATWDSYWYSLYNMSTNIAMAGNGVPFPLNEQMEEMRDQRLPAMLENADTDRPPINNPNLTFAAFTEGAPSFTQQPVLEDDTGRPDASTLMWDKSQSSGIVSPSSLAWTHLKGITWAKNFQNHFDVLPPEMAAKFRAQLLTTLAQVGINAALLVGGSRGNGALTHGDTWELLSEYRPAEGEIVDDTRRPHHHAAMLWFLSDINSLAQGGWFGYVNPRPLIPKDEDSDGVFDTPVGIQEITDGMARTTMELFDPAEVVAGESTRSAGQILGAVGYYGPQAGNAELESSAATYANGLAAEIEANLSGNGRVENGADNQAATQGIVAQGLLWASELDDVDHTGTAEDVLGYLFDELWDDDAGVYKSGADDGTYTITARDAGDITGGINAADALLGMDVKEDYARFFNQTFNRGRLQRAERPQSRDEGAEYTLPLPPAAGGEFGQAAVYNAEVEYDPDADEWSVTDDRFDTEWSLYLANQDIWISHWGGDFYQGRGVPGRSDTPSE
ncbi:plastocyanin/azurin family copper-binding protein [Natronomonas sp.]|uniref:plastocyanin/azurin family copper-binding protein n=1 Tax=Natronomonas sp. TaxID=2184060 RepID=UPI002FC28209